MRARDWTLQYNLIWAANSEKPTDCMCPEGYEPYNEECRKITTIPAVQPPDWNPVTLVAKPSMVYGLGGMLMYNSDYALDGSMTDGTKRTHYKEGYEFWYNPDWQSGAEEGPMNRCALWTSGTAGNYQSIGFAVCFNVGADKTYYVGIGVDNYMSMRIDGEYIINMPQVEQGYTFQYWHIYPVTIKKGFHVLEVIGSNVSSIASVGIQIYNATPSELLAVTSEAELAPYLVFDSKDEIGNLHTLGDYAYPIEPDYALVLCDGTPYYRKVEYQDCQ